MTTVTTDKNTPRKAIIYCRTASAQQNTPMQGCDQQQDRCRAYAEERGYKIDGVFADSGLSGRAMTRPGLLALLETINGNPQKRHCIIVDDLSRIGRNPEDIAAFHKILPDSGAKLECIATELEENPDSAFVQNILMARAELEARLAERKTA